MVVTGLTPHLRKLKIFGQYTVQVKPSFPPVRKEVNSWPN